MTPEETWRGVVIAEGLTEPSLINDLSVKRAHISVDEQPLDDAGRLGRWHLYWVDVDRETIDRLQASTVHGWYAHFWRDDRLLVVYDDARFEMHRTDSSTWSEATAHGLSQGLRPEQLDFPSDDSVGTLDDP